MQSILKIWLRSWGMAALMMLIIFAFSSRPSAALPNFGSWDYFIKKGGHALGYGLLALAYWRGLKLEHGKQKLAWELAICYAITDEIHQAFVPGRHPALFDILFFDNLGAMLGLIFWEHITAWRQEA